MIASSSLMTKLYNSIANINEICSYIITSDSTLAKYDFTPRIIDFSNTNILYSTELSPTRMRPYKVYIIFPKDCFGNKISDGHFTCKNTMVNARFKLIISNHENSKEILCNNIKINPIIDVSSRIIAYEIELCSFHLINLPWNYNERIRITLILLNRPHNIDSLPIGGRLQVSEWYPLY